MISEAGLGVRMEPRDDAGDKRRTDIETKNFYSTSDNAPEKLRIDVTVVSTPNAPKIQKLIDDRDKQKRNKHGRAAAENGALFLPLSVTACGYLSVTTRSIISSAQDYAKKRGSYVPGIDEHFYHKWTERIACVLHRHYCDYYYKLYNFSV